jgi:two-component system, response regulator FlrC
MKDLLSPIAEDPCSKQILDVARKAAKSQATILISGETGAGKEVLAHYIHQYSLVANGPFISVNCAALPDNMIEAILFGYEKGSFTSAITNYIGKFEQAQNGTLLLDEISEISIALQAKLLRVIQEKEVERLGGKKNINVNVRIIAASNRHLGEQVKQGLFRKDLYYRLNVIPIHCASLRERPLDILPLANFFIKKHATLLDRNQSVLTSAAKDKLINHSWPGNIREMENVIQRSMIMTDSGVIDENDIHLVDESVEENSFSSKLEANEAKIIIDILNEVDGCRHSAAKMLNISPRTLRYKLAKLRSIGFKIPNKISREDSYDH